MESRDDLYPGGPAPSGGPGAVDRGSTGGRGRLRPVPGRRRSPGRRLAAGLLALTVALAGAAGWQAVFPAPAGAAASTALAEPRPLDIGPKIRHKVLPVRGKAAWPEPRWAPASGGKAGIQAQASAAYDPVPGTRRSFLSLDYTTGDYVFKPFVLRGVSPHAEVWVAEDLAFEEGDPRNDRIEVTDAQVQYLLQEYETNIRPKEEAFFGQWDAHDGSQALLAEWGLVPPGYYQSADGQGREIILVDNIRDESYYDPSYPSYVAGFYSSAFELYFDRNIVTIDNLDWAQRLGPNDAPWRRQPGTGAAHLYEGTLAHELQHLIHDDHDPDEDSWINEGLSDFAEFLVGYGHPESHVSFYLDHPENSLTGWGDQGDRQILADYGLAYLFTLYLHDHFGGGPFLQALVADPANGSQGVNNALAAFGHRERFPEVYRDFQVALLADGSARAPERYRFASIDLSRYGSRGGLDLSAPTFGDGLVPGWGTDVVAAWQEGDPGPREVRFNGQDYASIPWQVVTAPGGGQGQVLWSGSGDLLDQWLVLPLDLRGVAGASLSFDHLYDIERGWDYGFVQVSTDGGRTWQSLANDHTTDELDPNAHPRVRENVPGFTGSSGGWRHETFDLSAYAGRQVLLAFRYVTDWGAAGNDDDPANDGWFIDNVEVRAGDQVLAGPFDGSSLDGFLSREEAVGLPVEYLLTVVEQGDDGKVKVREFRFKNRPRDEDLNQLRSVLAGRDAARKLVLITHAAPEDSARPAAYELNLGRPGRGGGVRR